MCDEPKKWPDELHTARLLLRAWQASDLTALHESWTRSEAHLKPWIPPLANGVPSVEFMAKMLNYWCMMHASGAVARYRLSLHVRDTQLGSVMLIDRNQPHLLEVGFTLDVTATGQGYASEAVQAMAELARTRPGVSRLLFRCDLRNIASIKVAERAGATRHPTEQDLDGDAVLGHWLLDL